MIFYEKGVLVRAFYSGWLDVDQIRVIEVSKNEYIIKTGRKTLTKREVMGAVVKYVLKNSNVLENDEQKKLLKESSGDSNFTEIVD